MKHGCIIAKEVKTAAEKLVECGVKAFWNFAHTDLGFSDDIIVENVHLSESLMKLTYRISEKARHKTGTDTKTICRGKSRKYEFEYFTEKFRKLFRDY